MLSMEMITMDQYRTSGTMNGDTLREFSKYFLPPRSKWMALMFILIFGAAAALNFMGGNTVMAVICTAAAVVFIVEVPLLKRKMLWNNIARLRENYPDGSCRYETFFTVDGVHIHNLSNGGESLLRYENFARAAETENVFFVISKMQQFFLVFKDCLTPEQQKSFLPFLKEKCPKLKIIR